jgi:capsular polysaccharide transport system permease protein
MQTGLKQPADLKRVAKIDQDRESGLPSPRQEGQVATSGRDREPSPQPGRSRRKLLALLASFSPTIFIGLYLGFVATDRYVSESAFVVRSASRPTGVGGFGALLQITGIARNNDTYSVNEFLVSRDAVSQLQAKLPLADMYGYKRVDLLSRYPSPIFGATAEQLYKYFSYMSEVAFNAQTGVTTLRVQAFQPQDAKAINATLLDLSEQLVNRLNERVREDTVRVYEGQVAAEQKRLVDDQVAIVAFQNKELTIDPKTNSLAVSQLVGRLGTDLAQTQTQIAATASSSPGNPALQVMKGQAAATANQISVERARIGDASDGLADKLAAFTRLDMDRIFAVSALTAANTALDAARIEADRQQLYLDHIVEPNEADYASRPQKLWLTTTAFLLNALALAIFWLVRSGMREHGAIGD